ncbi:DUF72 domain-containing protein [Flavobacterium sp. TMP13]|uniref:DUF72 domain-containing protein n=1 Tax=Flavobacterium sp. TMP13 TaxID=3425950 RepID=UPI003D781AD4
MEYNIHIGCSSFYNWTWKKVFYPEDIPSAKWFEYYCNYIKTFEINSTFYKFPTVRVMNNWYVKAPVDFIYSVKVPKEITHQKKLINCEELLKDFYKVCDVGLKEKLGPILFQFPPSYHYSAENLNLIIAQFDTNYSNVVEFRHISWWIPEVSEALTKNNISLCSVSHPQLPEIIFKDSPIVYIRLHGNEKMFYSSYSLSELNQIKETIISIKKLKSVYVYFNNTASSGGILNAIELKKLLF